MSEELQALILEVLDENQMSLNGISFDAICESVWRKAMARELMSLIDQEKVIHLNNRYRKAV